jgi:hypothetical protein
MVKKKDGSGGVRTRAAASDSGIEPQFRTLVLRIGLDRAESILSQIKAAFSSPDGRNPRRRRQESRSESRTSSESNAPSEVSTPPSA